MIDLFGKRSNVDTGDRSQFDFYPTPAWMTRSLVHFVPEIAGSLVFECASGDDAITDVLRAEFGCPVVTNDLDPTQPAMSKLDATTVAPFEYAVRVFQSNRIDWVITNPPFNVALPMLQHAVEWATVGVAFLLRKTFLEPTVERGEWLSLHPPARIIGLPRHKFRVGVDSTDSVSCDWMIWEKKPRNFIYPIEIDYRAKDRVRGRE